MTKTVTLEHALEILNQAVAADSRAMTYLLASRVQCNHQLSDHPTIQCGKDHCGKVATVGLLGILNGIFGKREDGYGHITAVLKDGGDVSGFVETDR